MFGSGQKINRVVRGHDGLPVSSKTLPLPQVRRPLRVHRGGIPISFCLGYAKIGAALQVAWVPGGSGRSGKPRCEGPSRTGSRPVTQQHARAGDPGQPAQTPSAPAWAHSRVAHRGGEMLSRVGRWLEGRLSSTQTEKGLPVLAGSATGTRTQTGSQARGSREGADGLRRRRGYGCPRRTTCPMSLCGRPGRSEEAEAEAEPQLGKRCHPPGRWGWWPLTLSSASFSLGV